MPPRKKITKAQYEALAAFRFALRRFLRFSEEAAEAVGVKPQQHQALLSIKGFPGRDHVTMGELAERLQIRHHSAVGLVDRLVTKKLAKRDPSASDRRQVQIKLTALGEKVLEQLSAAHHEQLRHMGPALRGLMKSLGKIDEPS